MNELQKQRLSDSTRKQVSIVENMDEESEVVVVSNVYGDFCVRKARRKRQKLLVKELFFDYANNTTLHGLPYISKRGLSLIEKIFWFITFVISFSMCAYLISKVWVKWRTSPVIVTVSEELVPVGKIPFPSVMICPQVKCKATVYNYSQELEYLSNLSTPDNYTMNDTTRERAAKFAAVALVCSPDYYAYENFEDDISDMYGDGHYNSSDLNEMLSVQGDLDDFFYHCVVHGAWYPCENIFSKTVTSEGICYTMNSLPASDILRTENLQKEYKYLHATTPVVGWSMDTGYVDEGTNLNISYYPRPGSENGATPDVEVALLDYLPFHDSVCNAINSGYKVYIKHPGDFPQSSLYYYAVLNKQVSSMALSFSILNTSENLKDYDPELRQCYFPHERYLKYFKVYTASNCGLECLSNVTFETCGCVEYYMPFNTSDRICTQKQKVCILTAREKLRIQEANPETSECNCLPSCNSVDYEAEILKTHYNMKEFIKAITKLHKAESNLTGYQFSKLELYFKKPRFISMRRSELFGVTDFLANCGGLLGLFLGFSFLSFVELFYFLTLRLFCTLKKDLEEEKAQRRLSEQKKDENKDKQDKETEKY